MTTEIKCPECDLIIGATVFAPVPLHVLEAELVKHRDSKHDNVASRQRWAKQLSRRFVVSA